MDWRRVILLGAPLFLIAMVVVGSALDPTTPPVIAAVFGALFGFILGVVSEDD